MTGVWGGVFVTNLALGYITFAAPYDLGRIASPLSYLVLIAGIITCRATTVGMDVKKTKNLRLGITERVQHRAGFERGVFRQIHDELHAHRPVAGVMAFG